MMGKEVFSYFFELHGRKTHLFDCFKLLTTEKDCFSLYEKELAIGQCKFNRSVFHQHWAELGLWGFLGRCEPVELLRTLCSHGSPLKASCGAFYNVHLGKSYSPVHFQVRMNQGQYKSIQGILSINLGEGSGIEINPFLYLEERETLYLGSYFTEKGGSADCSFQVYFKKMEQDLCLPQGKIQMVLSRLFYLGFEIESIETGETTVLGSYNLESQVIRGHGQEEALFYLGASVID